MSAFYAAEVMEDAMRIDWTEPTDRKILWRRFAERRQAVSGCLVVTMSGCFVAVLACCAVRVLVPESSETLSWTRILILAVQIPLLFLIAPLLFGCLPTFVHLTEDGIMFQSGLGSPFFRYAQITSISFAEEDGLRLFKVCANRKKGVPVVRTAIASPKVGEADVMKFLSDIGQMRLWQGEYPEESES